MVFIFYLFLFLVFLGLIGVASNPPPNFGALGLIVAAGGGCGLLAYMGGSFLSLILFLVYLGGMLVVFSYSVAFTANLSLKNQEVGVSLGLLLFYMPGLLWGLIYFMGGWGEEVSVLESQVISYGLIQEVMLGAFFLYAAGGGFLIIGALALLLVLFVVLLVVQGMVFGTIRAI